MPKNIQGSTPLSKYNSDYCSNSTADTWTIYILYTGLSNISFHNSHTACLIPFQRRPALIGKLDVFDQISVEYVNFTFRFSFCSLSIIFSLNSDHQNSNSESFSRSSGNLFFFSFNCYIRLKLYAFNKPSYRTAPECTLKQKNPPTDYVNVANGTMLLL